MTQTADIVLFTVNDFETQQVWRAFGKTSDAEPNGPRSFWDYGEIAGARIVHARSNMADLAAGKSARDAMTVWHPALLIAVGIGWGADRSKQSIGDILVADPLIDAAHQKLSAKEGTQPRGDQPYQNDALRSIIATCRLDRYGISPDAQKQLQVGAVLSLPTLVDDRVETDRLINAYPDAIGGEMEGRGMVDAAMEAKCDWLLIKAICDWGYDKNAVKGQKERDQQIAARNAADFVRYAIDHGLASYAVHRREARARAGAATNPQPIAPIAAPMFNIGVNNGTVAHTIHTQNVTIGIPKDGVIDGGNF